MEEANIKIDYLEIEYHNAITENKHQVLQYNLIKCKNCFHGNDGCCVNIFGLEGLTSEISEDFYCKNWKKRL